MKAFLITVAILAGIVFIGYVLYVVALFYAWDSPGPTQVPTLYEYTIEGRVERLEGAIDNIVHRNQQASFVYKPDDLEQFASVTIQHKGDEITYRFYLEDCHSLHLLDNYELISGCGSATLTMLSIEKNGSTVYGDFRNLPRTRKFRFYKGLFEQAFYDSVRADLKRQPLYNSRVERSALHDTVWLDVYKGADTNDIRTRHIFLRTPGNSVGPAYIKLRKERYYDDSTVIITYDSATRNQAHRATFVNGKLFRQYY